MHTRILMGASALLMAITGVVASFLPQEILAYYGSGPDGPGVLLIQIIGGLYLGYAALNWMARGNLIGGIYSRPVALGNFLHFAVVGVVLLKAMVAGQPSSVVVAGALACTAFAAWFGWVLFTHPGQAGKTERS